MLPLDREIRGSAQRWMNRVDGRILRHRQEAAVAAEEAAGHAKRAGWALGWVLAAQSAPVAVFLLSTSLWALLPCLFVIPALWLWRRADRESLAAFGRSERERGAAEGMGEAVAELLARGAS